LMATDTETAEINQLFLEQAKESYILADASKFNRTALYAFANLSDITGLITEPGMSKSQFKNLGKLGVKVIAAMQ
ncbi:MAG: hypothetical protein WC082_01020, partial [Victivallales bacterium]